MHFVSLNIEHDCHIESVTNLLRRERPEVFCLQELLERDVSYFEKTFNVQGVFAPMWQLAAEQTLSHSEEIMGVGIFSALPIEGTQTDYYAWYGDMPVHHGMDELENPVNRVLLSATLTQNNIPYTFATTHFTWTPDGQPNDQQNRDLSALMKKLSVLKDFVLCGDLNAPRGVAVFDALAERYHDHIPAQYQTSIDPVLHRTKGSV